MSKKETKTKAVDTGTAKRFAVRHPDGKPESRRENIIHALHVIVAAGPVTVEQMRAKALAMGFSDADGSVTRAIKHQLPIELNTPNENGVRPRKSARWTHNAAGEITYVADANFPRWRTALADGSQRKYVVIETSTK